MTMAAEEIVREYREARNKKAQIKILADLNLCTKDEIIEVLRSKGVEIPEKKTKQKPDVTQKSDVAAGAPVEKEPVKEAPLAMPEIVKEAITKQMIIETEKIEECQRQMLESARNLDELNRYLAKQAG